MKKNYVRVDDNKRDITSLISNRRNLIKEGKYYDLFDQIFESISKRNYISVFDFLIDYQCFDLADRFLENCSKSNYNFKNDYIEKSNDFKFLFSFMGKEYDKLNYYISNVYSEMLNHENLFVNESFGRYPDFRDYIINYLRQAKIDKIKNKIVENNLVEKG
jgi:hypothetical protein